ncbi:hypothetical protein Droror1_Dr00020047 [Drosera rotundifolia]
MDTYNLTREWKLPRSKRVIRTYHLPNEEQRQIQLITALLLQFVHHSANLPDAFRTLGNSSVLVAVTEEIANTATPEGYRMIHGRPIQSHVSFESCAGKADGAALTASQTWIRNFIQCLGKRAGSVVEAMGDDAVFRRMHEKGIRRLSQKEERKVESETVQDSGDLSKDGLIGLPGLGLGSKKKSLVEILQDGPAQTRTLDLASTLEVGNNNVRQGGVDSSTYNLRSVPNIAFQFTFESYFQDSVAAMALRATSSLPVCAECYEFVPNGCHGAELLRLDSLVGDAVLKQLWQHPDAIFCCSLKSNVSSFFTFGNQDGLDMLETTLVALQDIMMDKVLDEAGRKMVCSEFGKIINYVLQ